MTTGDHGERTLDDALLRIGLVAAGPGCTGEEAAAEARAVAAAWWLDVQVGGTPPERLRSLVGELRRWCLLAAGLEARAWERQERAGSSLEAGRAERRSAAFQRAADELRLFE